MKLVHLFHYPRCIVFVFVLFFCSPQLFSEEASVSLENKENSDDMLLRRIVEFWESGQYTLVQSEIEKYLKENPKGTLVNELHLFLGDLHLKGGQYEEAISSYRKITDNSIKLSIFLNYLQSLFELKKYLMVISECSFYLKNYPQFNSEITQQVKTYLGYCYYEQAMKSKKEEAASFAQMAKPYFEDLLKTSFCEEAVAILTSLHHLLQDYRAASDLYFSLSEKYPERREELLFEAANCALEFDQELALQTYATICRTGKVKVQQAADQRMKLLYEMKKYSDLILLADSLADLCSKKNLPFFHFLLGSSYFEMKDYKHAVSEMRKYLDREESVDDTTRDRLALVMSAAHQMKDRELFEESFLLFEKHFPQDEELPKARLAKAILNKKDSRFVEAEKDFAALEPLASTLEDQDLFLFEYADLLLAMKEAKKSKQIFSKLLEIANQETLKREGLRGYVNASVAVAFDEQEKESALVLKKELVKSLEQLLSDKEALSNSERDAYLYLLGQCQFECGELAAAIEVLEPLTQKIGSFPHRAQAHLILAQCYDGVKADKKSFCAHVEKALVLNDPSLTPSSLHLLLFNGYFQIGQEDGAMLQKAAEHLYLAQMDEKIQIQKENGRWLSQYYYQRCKSFFEERRWRAKEEEKLCMEKEQNRAISILEKALLPLKTTVSAEEEQMLLQLALLYHWGQREEKAIELLETLHGQYKKEPGSFWNERDAVLLNLAQIYRQKQEGEKATLLFDEIIAAKRDPFAFMKASLEKIFLRISLLTDEQKTLDSAQVQALIAELRQIKLQRKLEYEPLHFEAGLACIDLQSSLAGGLAIEKKLALLQEMKDEFLSEGDVISKDYHEQRKKLKDKELLVQSYLQMIDLEILICKMRIEKEKKPEEALVHAQEVKKLIGSFLEENFALTFDLFTRMNRNKELLENVARELREKGKKE